MKRTCFIVFAAFLFLAVSAQAQVFQMGLKLQRSSKSLTEMRDDVSYDVKHRSTEWIKNSELGLFMRFNIWKISLQPEANFSIGAAWDSVEVGNGFFSRVGSAVDNMESLNLAVPVLVGFKVVDLYLMKWRIFVGPEFYTTLKGDNGFDSSSYSLIAGTGFDLIHFLYVDFRYSHYSDGGNFYRFGVGIYF